jgi:regulator-associated protein of mTOR
MPVSRGGEPPPTALPQAPARSGWLGFLPVSALEDNFRNIHLQAEEAHEVDVEEDELVFTFDDLPLVFNLPRHVQGDQAVDMIMQTWRMRERMKTVSVALVICLNVGVDPPDVTKTQPCARQECWVDPLSLNPQRALETIGGNLQRQYERWQPRARYRQSLDPTVEEVRRLATGLRRSAREERVLFHYNGHGVPRPTANGEIWVFNRSYTQYIPLSIYDLQSWMGSPSIYVYDCNNAGIIVDSFKNFAEQHEREYSEQVRAGGQAQAGGAEIPPPPSLRNCIQLAACSKDQLLPMNPDLPADLFTACLTTPIKVALRWFVMRNDLGHLAPQVKLEHLEKIPGQFGDRRTMLGELNWIFTAITDTIAWNTLPRDTFQKLFRQDLLVASLFRNFLLAERIMKSNDCTPVSQPKLPDTHQHSMWEAWDLAVDISLSQLKNILAEDRAYVPSSFFEEQLTAFEVWLSHGCEKRSPPEQLPIVLQVLLSQAHRLRALDLLGRFLDLGPWAVNLALSVGIFPYVLKLLQSSARELRPLLVFIWAKILAVDSSCQVDLVRDQSHKYFLTVLQDPAMLPQHKTWAVFVLSSVVKGYKQGQDEAVAGNLISICLDEMEEADPVFKQWLAICLGTVWDKHEEARLRATRCNAPESLETLLVDPTPEVRAAAVFALGTFIHSCSDRTEHANTVDQNIATGLLQKMLEDGSPLVRKELVVTMQYVVKSFPNNFITLMKAIADEEEGSNMNLGKSGSMSMMTLTRVSSEDKLSRQMKMQRRSVGGSVTELRETGSILTTPKRGRKSVLGTQHHTASLASLASLACYGSALTTKFKPFYLKVVGGLMVLERDSDKKVGEMAKQVLDSIYRKMVMADRERKGSGVFRSLSQELHSSLSAPGSPAKPSFHLGESPPAGLNTSLPSGHQSLSSQPWLSRSTVPDIVEDEEVRTNFLTWSAKHFSSKLMKLCEEVVDLESTEYWAKQWLYHRNENVKARAGAEIRSMEEGSGRLDVQLGVVKIGQAPSVLAYLPYTTTLSMATRDTILMLRDKEVVSSWGNGNSRISQITSLQYCNSHEAGLLVAGSDDGCVRVWGGWEDKTDPCLVTGWSLLPELVPQTMAGSRVSFGLQLAWVQQHRVLVGAGDARTIRLWDCTQEVRMGDLPTMSDSCVTCLDMDKGLLAASFGDGQIKIFDYRAPPSSARIMAFREHKQMVLSLKMQENGKLVSGCTDGVVKVWDIRRQSSISTLETNQPAVSLDIHQSAPVFAVWTSTQNISLHSLYEGKVLNQIRYHEGLLGNRLGPVNCLRFHPELVQLAAGSTDCHVSMFGYRKY